MRVLTGYEQEYENRRKLINNCKSNNRLFIQGFAVFDLGFVK
jgi:hypothetical protein